MGNNSITTQTNLIVPYPSNSTLYYLFTLVYTYDSPGADLYYHIVDLSLNDGRGDIIPSEKNKFLLPNLAGKLTAIPHTNGRDFWLIVHEMGSDAFRVALINTEGISGFDTQNIGEAYLSEDNGNHPLPGFIGYLKASPDGTMLATTITAPFNEPINLFDFDAEKGKISNYRPIKKGYGAPFGLSFSPDNSRLYVSFNTPYLDRENVEKLADAVYQYDVSSGDITKINDSALGLILDNPKTNIPVEGQTGGPVLFSLQLGSDGRIYGGQNWLSPYGPDINTLLVIDKPNASGLECSINVKRFDFGKGAGGPLLPNFMESYFNGVASASECSKEGAVTLYPNPTTDKIKINFLQGCDQNFTMQIYDPLGTRIRTASGLLTDAEIDISALASGIYFFVISNKYHQKLVKKVIKL